MNYWFGMEVIYESEQKMLVCEQEDLLGIRQYKVYTLDLVTNQWKFRAGFLSFNNAKAFYDKINNEVNKNMGMKLTCMDNYEIGKEMNIADYSSFYIKRDGNVCAVWVRAFSNDVNPSSVQYVIFPADRDEVCVKNVPTSNYSFEDVFPDDVTIHPCGINGIEVKYYEG